MRATDLPLSDPLQHLFERAHLDDLDADQVYDVFRQSYERETGAAWSKDKFLSRAHNWTFYGDHAGFVAVRTQRSGMKKLVGVAGDPRSIMKGLSELQTEGGAIWGAVSAPLAQMAKKRGMIVPHLFPGGPFFIKTLVQMIPASVFGGYEPEVTEDGGILFAYDDIGETTKYLIGNKQYFLEAMRMPEIAARIKEVLGLSTVIRLMGLKESEELDEAKYRTRTESPADKLADNPKFKAWFGNSVVKDEFDRPQVVYHGTPDSRFIWQDGFDSPFKSEQEKAFFFAQHWETANSYADDRRAFDYQNAEPEVIDVFLKIENPKTINWGGKVWKGTREVIAAAKEEGHDGVIITNVRDHYQNFDRTGATTVYVVFKPNQIKAVKNKGEFNPEDKRIQEGGLDEMAAPTPEISARTYYHGTGSETSARLIMAKGLQGRETQGRGHLDPIQGMVYMTPSIKYAIIYALCGDFSHAMQEDMSDAGVHARRKQNSEYGYVFVIKGSDLKDVQPDEDSVGQFLADNSEPIQQPWKRPDGGVATKPDGTPFMRTVGYKCALAPGHPLYRVYHYIKSNVTPTQFDRIVGGELAYQAAGGKRALKKMPDDIKIALINAGGHIAHNGAIVPSECWRIRKSDWKKLKKDGSNFFDVAERVR